jgi:hypothetical protein
MCFVEHVTGLRSQIRMEATATVSAKILDAPYGCQGAGRATVAPGLAPAANSTIAVITFSRPLTYP